jgi:hypothetical protein
LGEILERSFNSGDMMDHTAALDSLHLLIIGSDTEQIIAAGMALGAGFRTTTLARTASPFARLRAEPVNASCLTLVFLNSFESLEEQRDALEADFLANRQPVVLFCNPSSQEAEEFRRGGYCVLNPDQPTVLLQATLTMIAYQAMGSRS